MKNNITSEFECEIRFKIDDLKKLKRTFRNLSGELVYPYHEIDHYYLPDRKMNWDKARQNMRIRQWLDNRYLPTIYYSKFELIEKDGFLFKRSYLREGKISLYTGRYETCVQLLEDWGYEKWISIEKEAEFWKFPRYDFKTAYEKIKGLGVYGELEVSGSDIGEAKKQLDALVQLLELDPEQIDPRPISEIFCESAFV